MPTPSYELTRLDANNFEHLVNALAMQVLGAGLTGFGPGSDAGRDGYFEGRAPYPNNTECWSGRWYIQSKFHALHLSKDPQKWLLDQLQKEINSFNARGSRRIKPDIWIIATNIEPSGTPETGSFDAARALVSKFDEPLSKRFHIWGGRKILDLLSVNDKVSNYYYEFLTPGNVLKRLYDALNDQFANLEDVVRYLVVTQFSDQQYTKLEQAGAAIDNRPGIQRLFTDLPFRVGDGNNSQMAGSTLATALAQIHRFAATEVQDGQWRRWSTSPRRSRVWFIKGGPGQGKSTLTQYVAQIQRAALILSSPDMHVTPAQHATAEEVCGVSSKQGLWPAIPRIPVTIELKDYAFWYGQRSRETKRTLAYFSEKLTKEIGIQVLPGTLKRSFSKSRWLFVFDGLDEVPGDVKDEVASEIVHFVDDCLVGCGADAMIICTSRPQGYSGQFSGLDAATIELMPLSRERALECARPLLELERSKPDSRAFIETLKQALNSPAIAEIMTTPLQAHIMAVIIRDGGRPPERRWQLFNTFYEVIKKREANRNLPDRKLAVLLREGDVLLRALHNRLGFELHYRAETSAGATTSIPRSDLRKIVTEVVNQLQEKDVKATVNTLMKAATERLVLVNTPENGEFVRFDIRPLQEFFAAEHIYKSGNPELFSDKLRVIAADSHWREVMHFLLSALIENGRTTDLAATTSILEDIDSGQSPYTRILFRRIAKGAIMTARLLTEGVLEQDRQIRSRFVNAILPIAGQSHADEWLVWTLQKHSRAWLQDVLITALGEQAIPETMGAALVLSRILNDRDRRSLKVVDFIRAAPDDYRNYFVYRLVADSPYEMDRYPKWVMDICLDVILCPEWATVAAETLRSAISVVSKGGVNFISILESRGFSSEIAKLLSIIFDESFIGAERPESYDDEFNFITTEYYASKPELDSRYWKGGLWSEFSRSTGMVALIGAILKLHAFRSQGALKEFLEACFYDPECVDLLPFRMGGYTVRWEVGEGELPSIDCIIQTDRPGCPRLTGPNLKSGSTKMGWMGACVKYPNLIWHIIQDDSDSADGVTNFFLDPVNSAAILHNIKQGNLFDRVYQWGKYLNEKFPFAELLREYLIEESVRPVSRNAYYFQGVSAFQLRFPDEAVLLPHILGFVLDCVDGPYRFAEDRVSKGPALIGILITDFIVDASQLPPIFRDCSRSVDERGAALCAFVLHPRGDLSDIRLAYDLYSDGNAAWFVPAIGHALVEAISTRDHDACELFGWLLGESAGHHFSRGSIRGVLDALREVPGSPVTTDGRTSLWS